MAVDLSILPDDSGVYLMKDDIGEIIYVGKAISLKKRVRQYFQSNKNLMPRTRTLVKHIKDIEIIITDNEIDALVLEANLIKKYKPRYNVRLKDDKRYPYVKITINKPFPRIFITRKRVQDGALYFGPYTNIYSIRKTLEIISQALKLRRCRLPLNKKKNRPCLDYQIKKCSGPCAGLIEEEEYMQNVQDAIKFLKGDTSNLAKKLEHKMHMFANEEKYEQAAIIRDSLEAIKVLTLQQITTSGTDDRDIIVGIGDNNTVYIQIYYIRHGKMVGKADHEMTTTQDTPLQEVISQFIKQYYLDSPIPTEIILEHNIPDHDLIKSWLKKRAGKEVYIIYPQRGDKRKLIEMALKNVQMTVKTNKLKQNINAPLEGMNELKSILNLSTFPSYIEGFDISNTSGTDSVGSMVVFENGLPANSKYRQYNIKTVNGIDDFASMAEVVKRRYTHLKNEKLPYPDLILIDGGHGQLFAAKKSIEDLNIDIPIIGLAKRFEHIITTKKGSDEVIILPKTSAALKILMQIRDEAHRFAVSSHRRKRSARLTLSLLDSINGVGEKKKMALISHFGSIEKIGNSNINELCKVDGINEKLAKRILDVFHEHGPWN